MKGEGSSVRQTGRAAFLVGFGVGLRIAAGVHLANGLLRRSAGIGTPAVLGAPRRGGEHAHVAQCVSEGQEGRWIVGEYGSRRLPPPLPYTHEMGFSSKYIFYFYNVPNTKTATKMLG